MALIGPGMHGDALDIEIDEFADKVTKIGKISAARIAQQCNFIHINAQHGHRIFSSARDERPAHS